jgi:hypothetical protein
MRRLLKRTAVLLAYTWNQSEDQDLPTNHNLVACEEGIGLTSRFNQDRHSLKTRD